LTQLEQHLSSLKDSGRKLFVPYFMAGLTNDWTEYVMRAADAGASAIEIGMPFSDPIMDGASIQAAGAKAIENGMSVTSAIDELAKLDVGIPVIIMSYFNVLHHLGIERSVGELVRAKVAGSIIPDLSLEEIDEWARVSAQHDLSTVMMVAPSTPPSRIANIVSVGNGFVYASGRMAVTGESNDATNAESIVQQIREFTNMPVLVGIGISSPDQARLVNQYADGVIVGSAIINKIMHGNNPREIGEFIQRFTGQ
jgi:tryptophan synthase alpha chain